MKYIRRALEERIRQKAKTFANYVRKRDSLSGGNQNERSSKIMDDRRISCFGQGAGQEAGQRGCHL